MQTKLGKITSVAFGHCGYQNACIGIDFCLEGEGWSTGDTQSAWDPNIIKASQRNDWTEKDRNKQFADIMRYISDILNKAKVHSITQLCGIPVEVIFKDGKIQEWRVLEEVL